MRTKIYPNKVANLCNMEFFIGNNYYVLLIT